MQVLQIQRTEYIRYNENYMFKIVGFLSHFDENEYVIESRDKPIVVYRGFFIEINLNGKDD